MHFSDIEMLLLYNFWLEFLDFSRYSRMMKVEYYCKLPKNLLPFCLWVEPRSLRFLNDVSLNLPQNCKCTGIICSILHKPRWCSPVRSFTTSVSLNHGASSLSGGDHLSNDNIVSDVASENDLPPKLGADEVIINLLFSLIQAYVWPCL